MAAPSLGSDMFDEIVMAEDRFHGEGYQEGYAEGSHAGAAEGRRCGALHGAKIGSEIGSYLGFALTWQHLLPKCTDEKNSKKMRALDSLIGMIQKFPYEDPTYEKLQDDPTGEGKLLLHSTPSQEAAENQKMLSLWCLTLI